MHHTHRRLHGARDLHAGPPEPAQRLAPDRDPHRLAIDDGIEGAAEGNVHGDDAVANRHRHPGAEHERRHILERHAVDSRPGRPRRSPGGWRAGDPGAHDPGRRLEHDPIRLVSDTDQPPFQGDRADGDHPVTAHGAVALVVHEEHAGVRRRRARLGQHRAIHVGVPAGLVHQRPAERVTMLPHPVALLEHRLANRGREPAGDEPQRLAGRMRVDRLDAMDH